MDVWIENIKEMVSIMATAIGVTSASITILLTYLTWRKTKNRRLRGQAQPQDNLEPKIHSPAAIAELILHLLLKDDEAEAVGGDLQERYSKKVERFGKRGAYIWLWSQVLRSIWPLLKRFFTAGGFLAAAEFIRRLLS